MLNTPHIHSSLHSISSNANDLQFNYNFFCSTKFPQCLSMDEALRITMMLTIHLENYVCVIFRLMCNVLKTHLLFRTFFFICGFVLRTCNAKINGLTDVREHKFHGECRILAVCHPGWGIGNVIIYLQSANCILQTASK